jgi:hypothetical protein
MKNIQVIYGALNSVFGIYEVPDDLFKVMFPNGSDIGFTDEVDKAFRKRGGRRLWNVVYGHPVDKKRVRGIQGTLHLDTSPVSKKYFPTRKEADVWIGRSVSPERSRVKPNKRQQRPSEKRGATKR